MDTNQLPSTFVHGIFPYMAYKRELCEEINLPRKAKNIRHLLIRFCYSNQSYRFYSDSRHHPQAFTEPQLARIVECWRYILEIVKLCDTVQIEQACGERAPDLVVTYGNCVYVIEAKALRLPFVSLRTSVNNTLRYKLAKQTRGVVKHLSMTQRGGKTIEAYGLFFNTDPDVPFSPQWMHMTAAKPALVSCRDLPFIPVKE